MNLPKQILLIEDNEQNLELVTFLLEEAGFEVHTAKDADEAKQQVESGSPDLILLDIHLPGCNGLTLVEEFRKKENLKRTPIIALTAHAMQGDRERFLEGGCDGYIPKPIQVGTFVQEVCAFLPEIY
ncbi:MAG TPA: response regulator [Thermoanaerobaculia bacterium]|nr:response regulator [Thermoanaerobaculia bacterium]HUM30394.1 response regulator [Thermoanaerobaculia bacterium]HXK68595.1 response regulator [Thermoanaerobaculia bacterium]